MTRSLLLLAAAAAFAGCADRPAAGAADSAAPAESGSLAATTDPAALVTADTATVELPLALPAQLYVEHDAALYARSAGVIEAIAVDLGGRVEAGALLARLESADQEIALDQARERHGNARQQAERNRALTAAGVVTQADSERVELELREAELALKKAQRDLDLTRIVAPFAGVVTSRTARVGRLVSPGDSLFRLTALAPVLAAVRVPEAAAFGVRIGAEATVEGPRGERARARVIRASPVLDPASGTREVVLQLAGGDRLPPGSGVTVQLGSITRRVVTLPRESVDSGGFAVVWDTGRTVLRQVTVGGELPGDRIEVVDGVAPGEKVLRTAP
ncbi:MAG TPA: efflux RND transporter periplasmic adaptor subunit [Gemmatimonadales bacterium]|nr:efflux RND transporter periplasmic adaptor subunit [Gemmatimonadales bacterium]